jgi:hypothetical protein
MNVYYSSPWIPVEWIEAHGFEPRGVWSAEGFGRGALPLSAGVCAFSEAMRRFAEAHPEAAVIFTTACDQMRRSYDAFADAPGHRGFLFNLPATWQFPAARRMYCSEMERLGRFLQAHGGRAPAGKDLKQIIERRAGVRQSLRELVSRGSARQFARAVGRFHWDGSMDPPDPSPTPAAGSIPVAIIGGPLTASQWGVLDLIEAAGARIVLNATETGERSLLPAFSGFNDFFKESSSLVSNLQGAQGAEHAKAWTTNVLVPSMVPRRGPVIGDAFPDPFDFLARNYFENIVDVFQRPNTRLYSWLGERLAAREVRGIVLWIHTGCDLWRAEAQTLRETFRRPVLLLEADEALAGSPREASRIQAFVEMLK